MKTIQTCILILICTATAIAQEETFQPAEELQRFAPLLGTWEGSGTAVDAIGDPENKWTAKESFQWVLGGHYLRSHMTIDAEGLPAPLQFQSYYGWDKENRRYMVYMISNTGSMEATEIHWPRDDTMVTASQNVIDGKLTVERWVTKLHDGKVSFVGHKAEGAGDFFVQVRGEMIRTKDKHSDVKRVDAALIAETSVIAAKMNRLSPLSGTYHIKGWVMQPGQPKMDIAGRETAELIFGKSLMEFRTTGEPTDDSPFLYEGLAWMAWNEHAQCYKTIALNNMGEAGMSNCYFQGDDKMAMTSAHLQNGRPSVMRYVVELDDQGRMSKATGDAITGDGEPERTFEGTYEIE